MISLNKIYNWFNLGYWKILRYGVQNFKINFRNMKKFGLNQHTALKCEPLLHPVKAKYPRGSIRGRKNISNMFTYPSEFIVTVASFSWKTSTNNTSEGNCTPHCYFRWMQRPLMQFLWIGVSTVMHILFVDASSQMKMCFITEINNRIIRNVFENRLTS